MRSTGHRVEAAVVQHTSIRFGFWSLAISSWVVNEGGLWWRLLSLCTAGGLTGRRSPTKLVVCLSFRCYHAVLGEYAVRKLSLRELFRRFEGLDMGPNPRMRWRRRDTLQSHARSMLVEAISSDGDATKSLRFLESHPELWTGLLATPFPHAPSDIQHVQAIRAVTPAAALEYLATELLPVASRLREFEVLRGVQYSGTEEYRSFLGQVCLLYTSPSPRD